ncbi:MAG: protein kinase [Acidobacteria bacterium]|nr:protein kinase [Acidobacteriota bacterium]
MLGKIIGNYQITHELAHGRTGTVYRGRNVGNSREAVIKEISLSSFPVSTRIHLRARLRRETFIQAQLNHQNIVKVYESFSKGDNCYMVTEYVHGMSLRELLNRQGVPTPAQAVYLLKQALSALEYAHLVSYMDESDVLKTGILHRDLKPENLMVDVSGRLKITDFGIVRMPDRQTLAPPSFQPGTVEYMPPEQIRGLELDARSDIFSLGVTFYEILTGQIPYLKTEKNAGEESRSMSYTSPVRIVSELRPEVPHGLSAIIMRSILRTPGERFQSASEFLKAIREFERNLKDDSFSSQTISSPPRGTTGDLTPGKKSAGYHNGALQDNAANAHKSSSQKVSQDKPPRERVTKPYDDSPRMRSSQGVLKETGREASQLSSSEQRRSTREPNQTQPNASVVDPNSGRLFRQFGDSANKSARIYLVTTVSLVIVLALIGIGYFMVGRKLSPLLVATTNETVWQPIEKDDPAKGDEKRPAATAIEPSASQGVNFAEKLELAREADKQGKFNQAISLYEDYLRHAADSPEQVSAKAQADKLKQFVSHLNAARAALNRQDYSSAKKNYAEALKLRPYSRMVQNALAQAESKMAGNP